MKNITLYKFNSHLSMDIDGGFLHLFIASKSATNNFIPVFFPICEHFCCVNSTKFDLLDFKLSLSLLVLDVGSSPGSKTIIPLHNFLLPNISSRTNNSTSTTSMKAHLSSQHRMYPVSYNFRSWIKWRGTERDSIFSSDPPHTCTFLI